MTANIIQIWTDVLGVDDATLEDDFFDQGGDSLLAVKIITRVKELLGADVPVVTLFEYSMLGEFIEAVTARVASPGTER